jgi:hypothetical protein
MDSKIDVTENDVSSLFSELPADPQRLAARLRLWQEKVLVHIPLSFTPDELLEVIPNYGLRPKALDQTLLELYRAGELTCFARAHQPPRGFWGSIGYFLGFGKVAHLPQGSSTINMHSSQII